jgi:hypothetical protein
LREGLASNLEWFKREVAALRLELSAAQRQLARLRAIIIAAQGIERDYGLPLQ